MAKLQLIDKRIHIDGHAIGDSDIEAILKKAIPLVHIRFVYDDDEFAICEMNGKKVSIANMIFLKEGKFESISQWEKGINKTIKFIQDKLAPDKTGLTEEKETDLL